MCSPRHTVWSCSYSRPCSNILRSPANVSIGNNNRARTPLMQPPRIVYLRYIDRKRGHVMVQGCQWLARHLTWPIALCARNQEMEEVLMAPSELHHCGCDSWCGAFRSFPVSGLNS